VSIPPNFAHMGIETENGVPRIRVRLTAVIAIDGEIEETIHYILRAGETGEPEDSSEMPRSDRTRVEVHLPAGPS
jgi:putative ATP-dependent endonuclease of OLD family